MASLTAGAGLVLLVAGILTVAVALGLIVSSEDAAETQGSGVLAEPGAGAADRSAARVGQTLAIGGGAIAFLGLVFITVGRGDRPVH